MAARCWTQISAISVCQATSKPNSPLSCPSSHLQRRRQLSTGQQGGLLDEPLVHAARWCHVPATKQWAVGQWEVGSQAERGELDSREGKQRQHKSTGQQPSYAIMHGSLDRRQSAPTPRVQLTTPLNLLRPPCSRTCRS